MAEEIREVTEPKREVVVERDRSSHVGTVVAVIVGLIIVVLLFMYGLPYLNGSSSSSTDVNIQAPTPAATGN